MPHARAIAATLLVAATQTLFAQANLTGAVVDRFGQAIGGVTVSTAELHRAAITTGDGRFDLGSVPAGQYTLLARKLGYAPASERATAGTPVTLSLADAAVRIEPVNITAARDALDAAASPL